MFAWWVTWLDSRRWPSPWRATCRTSAPANRPSVTTAGPNGVSTSSGAPASRSGQRVGARPGDDPDPHRSRIVCRASGAARGPRLEGLAVRRRPWWPSPWPLPLPRGAGWAAGAGAGAGAGAAAGAGAGAGAGAAAAGRAAVRREPPRSLPPWPEWSPLPRSSPWRWAGAAGAAGAGCVWVCGRAWVGAAWRGAVAAVAVAVAAVAVAAAVAAVVIAVRTRRRSRLRSRGAVAAVVALAAVRRCRCRWRCCRYPRWSPTRGRRRGRRRGDSAGRRTAWSAWSGPRSTDGWASWRGGGGRRSGDGRDRGR